MQSVCIRQIEKLLKRWQAGLVESQREQVNAHCGEEKVGHIILPPPPPFYLGLGGGFMLFVPYIFQRSPSSAVGFTLTLKVICPCALRFFYVSFEGSRRNCGNMARFGYGSVVNLPSLWLLVFNRFLGWFEILHLMFLVQEFFCFLLSI